MATEIRREQTGDSASSAGTTSAPDAQAIQELKLEFGGEIIYPGDAGYDTARRVWNGAIDRRPALIARCTGLADVLAAVKFAREHRLLVAVRGGGHNVAGNATCDGEIVIDLSPMKAIAVDPAQRIAHAEPGLTWGEFDAATQAHGLACTGGIQSTTGIAGFTLGGGFGYLARKHGLTCDNLLSAQVVIADGRVLTASKHENADLFWGLRGGGGNFGIVTRFDVQLHPLGDVLGGMLIYPIERAREVIRVYRDFVKDAPDELFTILALMTAPSIPELPQELQGQLVPAILVCYSGDPHEGASVLQPLRDFEPPAADLLKVTAYGDVQTMLDAGQPTGTTELLEIGVLHRLHGRGHRDHSLARRAARLSFLQGTAPAHGRGDRPRAARRDRLRTPGGAFPDQYQRRLDRHRRISRRISAGRVTSGARCCPTRPEEYTSIS